MHNIYTFPIPDYQQNESYHRSIHTFNKLGGFYTDCCKHFNKLLNLDAALLEDFENGRMRREWIFRNHSFPDQ